MSKRITALALAALMLLLVALPAGAVIQATSVEIRGEVHNAANASINVPNATGCANTTEFPGNFYSCAAAWNATNFAAFWYDLKDNLKTETLVVLLPVVSNSDRTIDANTLWYNTTNASKTLKIVENTAKTGTTGATADFDKFQDGLGRYYVVGWQASPYVAVKGKVKKLAKLILEQGNASSEKKSLTVGETWDIGNGWTVMAQSIDAKASPRKAWLVLSKDGVKKDDKVINDGAAYAYIEKSFAGESDVPLFATYIDSVFAGATSDMVQLRYTWVIDTAVTEIKSADKFGNLEVANANDTHIQLYNKDRTVSLSQDTTVDIFGDLKFKVADSSTTLRYYPMVLRTTPGKHEVRGSVVEGTASAISWNALTFAAFWYDLKDNLRTETLQITAGSLGGTDRTIDSNTLWYNTTNASKTLKIVANGKATGASADFDKFQDGVGAYYVVGWQAQPYVAVKGKVKKLAKLILEQGNASSEKKSLTVGETWDIGNGWTVMAQSIDAKASPRKAWLVISKDGVKKDDKVINDNASYAYIEKSFAGESDVPLFATYVDSVFAGATSDMVQLRYTWVIDTAVTEIKSADKFGNLEVANANDTHIQLYNKDRTVSLSKDTTADIFGELKFKVADSDTVRFYPMVEYEIGGVVVTPTPGVTPGVTPGRTPGVTPTNVTVTPTTPAPTTPVTTTAAPTPVATTPTEPGFEAVFAIAGLLAVAYLVLRRK